MAKPYDDTSGITLNTVSFQNISITSHKLNGNNFLQWSQSVKLFIRGRGKFGYLSSTTTKPAEKDEESERWEAENSMIMSWLINSMDPSVGRTYLFLPTAHDIWNVVNETYSDLGNAGQWFELKQGEKNVTQYYTDLKTLWQEVDMFNDYEWSCAKGRALFQKMVEKERVFEFLVGLNKELDEVRGRILGHEPLPSTREVFSEVRREESRRTVMLGGHSPNPTESFALFSGQPPRRNDCRNDRDRPICEHCNKSGHTKAKCWKLHGKPAENFSANQNSRNAKGFHASSEDASEEPKLTSEPSAFSKEQLEQLYQLMSSHSISNTPNPSSYIASLSLAQKARKGSIIISPSLTLLNVLHVPKLSCNLISVNRIIHDCKCIATITFAGFEFQDPCSGKMIGDAKEVDGLYHLVTKNPSDKQVQKPRCFTTLSCENEIMLWHYSSVEPIHIHVTNPRIAQPINSQPRETQVVTNLEPPTELRAYSRRMTQPCNVPPASKVCQPSDSTMVQGTTSLSLISSPNLEPSIEFFEPIALRKGVRSCTTKHPISNFVSYHKLSPDFKAFSTRIMDDELPKSIHEALEVPRWREVVFEELKALKKNDTWDLTPLPEGKRSIGSKWVFTIKYHTDGSVERYKARLVARGFTQTYGLDYKETFAPVAKLNTVRVLLSLAANLDCTLRQFDVKNAFLNGELEEEVFMEVPLGFDELKKDGRVCKLKKSIYGLKQSPRAWFERFTRAMKQHGYTQAQSDHIMFYKHNNGKIAILIVYVDDIVMTGDNTVELESLKNFLSNQFEVKDIGQLKYFLGMEVARSSKGIIISQRKYVIDILKEIGLLGCKPVATPIDPNQKLEKEDGVEPVDKNRYQKLVGKLIYLDHTRPDIAFVVSLVSQFMHCPSERHFKAVYRILHYLKGSPGKGIMFSKNGSRRVEIFTDADWGGSSTDRRSTTGYCSFIWGNLVTWRSKKQPVVSSGGRVQSHGARSMTKHVEIDRHFIKERLKNGDICILFVPSSEQLADVLTKGLFTTMFEGFMSKLGMIDIYSPA
ncbi:Detected protein of unknown function [Hibiscus syriacus]|uniref:Retrovirus-related Pol polyprotein from transposon RE1 n=1 Tax=Hibiscus syriacus TaxID=106335 RepID=A0A6A3CVK4_HIBSY|nr:Detected protein of unknown function [Hibiscus syriacus]